MTNPSPSKGELEGRTVLNEWVLKNEVGRGNNGIVYLAEKDVMEYTNRVACKLMPKSDLRAGWEKEIEKCLDLYGHPNVIDFIDFGEEEIEFKDYGGETHIKEFACLLTEFVEGDDLQAYIKKNEGSITLSFVESILEEILRVFHAMDQRDIGHHDLHAGNILLSKKDIIIGEHPTVKITDFGIGGSQNSLDPKDDYAQLGDITLDLLQAIDRGTLDSIERFHYEFLRDDFVDKRVLETDPTQGEYVKNPEKLLEILQEGRQIAQERLENKRDDVLENPFDYLSCEQMGDSFDLIETLYSHNYPGYNQIRSRGNTILTGPRGCGKTTILKNLALETKLESGSIQSIDDIEFIGVYYPCRDLYFAFHYLDENPSIRDRNLLIHYFSVSLLKELIQTIGQISANLGIQIHNKHLKDFEEELSQYITNYSHPPENTNLLYHLDSVLTQEKNRVGTALRHRPSDLEVPEKTLPVNFLAKESRDLIQSLEWGKNIPIYFLIDDYSLPTISEGMQSTLNDLLMERWEEVFFKIATESITALHRYNSSGKITEETREFEIVDFASHFIGEPDQRKEFVEEVINTRLENTSGIDEKYTDLADLLGPNPYESYNELARKIRDPDHEVTYAGAETISDLFSGDLSEMLRLVRGMFEEAANGEKWENGDVDVPISQEVQDRVIREHGGRFLNKIESVPETGPKLRQIAEEFGKRAHRKLLDEDSKNQTGNPPAQAFRIELRDPVTFTDEEQFAEVAQLLRSDGDHQMTQGEIAEETETIYNGLLRYGVFLIDFRGKSIRGGVVKRLYLRRLLIPKFNLTPSQRDFIGMEASEFLYSLLKPAGFSSGVEERPQDKSLGEFKREPEDDDPRRQDEAAGDDNPGDVNERNDRDSEEKKE